jgi:serine/threonine protein kinase
MSRIVDPSDRGVSPTVRDGGEPSALDRTRRDGGAVNDGDAIVLPYRRVRLPPLLEAQFEIVQELPRGGEADVLVVVDRSTRERKVIKLYGESIVLDEAAMVKLESAHSEHVVMFSAGRSDQQWFEIQEYCEGGSLRDLMGRQGDLLKQGDALGSIVREIASALTHLHRDLAITHRDLKPENIFVRREQPLDLVLGDFGIARAMSSSVRLTRAWGTPAYWPPESAGGQVAEVSPAWDWWSLGMIIAEIEEGHHPLQSLLASPGLIPSYLAQNAVPLDGVSDLRVRMLLQGLLTRSRTARWSGDQVDRWLEGDSPPVTSERISTSTRTVRFEGSDYNRASDLANAFQNNWVRARQSLFQVREAILVDETKALCRSEQLSEASLILEQPTAATEAARSFARLLVEMNRNLSPIYNGVELTLDGLTTATATIISSGAQNPFAQTLEEIEKLQILVLWRSLDGLSHGPTTDDAWRHRINDFQSQLNALNKSEVSLTPDEQRSALAWLLRCALMSVESHDALTDSLKNADASEAKQATWWAQLAAQTSNDASILLAVLTRKQAVNQVVTQREAMRQKSVEDDRLRKQHQELQRQWSAYQSAASSINPRRSRDRLSFFRSWRTWTLVFYIPSVYIAGYFAGNLITPQANTGASASDFLNGLFIAAILALALTFFRVARRDAARDAVERAARLKPPSTGCGDPYCQRNPCPNLRSAPN